MSSNHHPWPEVRLGNILTTAEELVALDDLREYITITVKRRHGGLEPREKLLGHQIRTKKQYRLLPGAFIISRVQCWHQAYAVVPEDIPPNMIASTNYDQFTISPEVDPRYFWWFSHSPLFTETVRSSAFGVVIEKMVFNRDAWLEKKIPLPPPDEQRRIVSRIEELIKRTEGARMLRGEVSGYAEQLMAAEEMRIWPHTNLESAKTLDEVTTYLARGRQSHQGPSGHYLIKTQNVQMGRYVPTDMTLSPDAAGRVKPEAKVTRGDVLIACSAAGCLGRVAFYDEPEGEVSTDTHVAIARPNPELVLPEYLYCYLRGASGQFQLRSREKGDWKREKIGFRLTELNVADMRLVPVPVPPLSEQRRIVAYLDGLQDKVDSLKKLQSETAAELDALMPSILSKAFRGEL